MATIRERYLPVLDLYRGMLDTTWDLRRFDVFVRVSTWAPGTLPGAHGATATTVDTPIVVAGGARPAVEQLAQRDVIASGGELSDIDFKIGPLTPKSAAFPAGVDPSVFDPPLAGSSTEILFNIAGPGLPAGGGWFKKIAQDVSGNFGLYLTVRKTGEKNV